MAQCYLSYFLLRAGEAGRARRYIDQRLAAGLDAMAHDAEWLPSVALFGEAALQLDIRPAVLTSCTPSSHSPGYGWSTASVPGATDASPTTFTGSRPTSANRARPRRQHRQTVPASCTGRVRTGPSAGRATKPPSPIRRAFAISPYCSPVHVRPCTSLISPGQRRRQALTLDPSSTIGPGRSTGPGSGSSRTRLRRRRISPTSGASAS